MRKGMFSAIAAAVVLAASPLAAQDGQQAEGDGLEAGGPHLVVPAATLIGRTVFDDVGRPVALVRDVVFARATGESLAVLEILSSDGAVESGDHVVMPLAALRLPRDGTARLIAGLPPLSDMPTIDMPPRGLASGLMVPPPDAGPLEVIEPPQVAQDPPADR